MRVINARNINEAYAYGVAMLREYGFTEPSRAGEVEVLPTPVTTRYLSPMERVLLAPGRVGNPVFHLMSAIWMMAGENHARWLDQFVKDFSPRYAEINPKDRQAVLQMWDPDTDLGGDWKDRPCNLCVLPRVNNGCLDITVMNRSNDIIWGLYGENHVQFSLLQEYIAASLGIPIGTYWHVSNNFHGYTDILSKLMPTRPIQDASLDPYASYKVAPTTIVTRPTYFIDDCRNFVAGNDGEYMNKMFDALLVPMRDGEYDKIREAGDWFMAIERWHEEGPYVKLGASHVG